MSWIVQNGEQVLLNVLVVPRASSNQITGIHGDRLRIRLLAPPVDGKANSNLVAFLSTYLNLRQDQFNIVKGQKGRRKTIEITQVDFDVVKSQLILSG